MIDKRYAQEQILRLRCFDRWLDSPGNSKILEDYTLALQAAESEVIAFYVITEWIARETKMPTVADLLRISWDENEKRAEREDKQPPNCPDCHGSRFVTRWYLVTYNGSGYNVRRSERMDFENYSEALEFEKKLAISGGTERQQLLSAAEKCSCARARSGFNCKRCQDRGYYGGIIGGKFGGSWKWCDCRAAIERREQEPASIEDANRERGDLIRIFSARDASLRGLRPVGNVAADDYKGDF
jgi:hypothetical protein